MDNINISSLKKLEFNKIIDILSTYALTIVGKELCQNLLPLYNKKEVQKAQNETSEALTLLYRKGSIPIYSINDITKYLLLLDKGNYLSTKPLLDIANVLKTSRLLKEYYFENPLNETDALTGYFNNLYTNQRIEQSILSTIIDEDTIDDKASITLLNIRKEMRKVNQDIRAKLQSVLNSKYAQEPIITIKNNRFVVPIKSEYRQDVKGFIHDTSTSGSTIFIEPMSVFELNNKLNSLKNDEACEIEKILQRLSSSLFEIIDELKNTYKLIGIIDFIFAKAKYSKDIDAVSPIISDKREIDLIKCRHPLIGKDSVVPISINLGKNFSCLVITGPNTGGKTVSLKTVGLLCAMGMAGLHIPAKENSRIHVFDHIFADIGDEQSIGDSLSTFSSHMVNIVEITNNSTSNSLVLLDELGSGTDPIEGAALAISELDFLVSKGCLIISTTHYSELKNYALITEGFENASCEFDIKTLSPTYRLLLGVPGKSNAFAISKKLGLDDSIIKKAESGINKDTLNIEELLKNIYDDKLQIELEKEKIEKNSKEIEELKASLENEKNDISSKKTEIMSKAKDKAKQIILDAKEDANSILREMESTHDTKKLNKLRKDLNDILSDLSEDDENDNNNSFTSLSIEEAIPNTEVFIPSLNQYGSIVSRPSKDSKVMVLVGNAKMKFDISNLTLSNKKKEKEVPTTNYSSKSSFIPKDVKTEINVIGFNIEEATFAIDKFLDTAAMSRLEIVRIVHGKGTRCTWKRYSKIFKKSSSCRII